MLLYKVRPCFDEKNIFSVHLCLIIFNNVVHIFVRVEKKKEKMQKRINETQERAFWNLHRPAVCGQYYLFNLAEVFISINCLDFTPFLEILQYQFLTRGRENDED